MQRIEKMADGDLTKVERETRPVDPMVSMIERVVLDPDADLAKLERMLAMKERMDAEAARREFNNALAACQAEMQPVAKNKHNEQTRSNYANLAAIYATCKPVAAKYGFSFSTFPAQTDKPGHMGVRWTLRHDGGHEQSDIAEIPVDDKGMKGTTNKTATHAFGSTASYARRYLFCMIFDVATDDDTDGNNKGDDPTISEDQFRKLRDKLKESGMPEPTFHQAFGHRSPETADLTDFPARFFDEAMARLDNFIRNKKAAK